MIIADASWRRQLRGVAMAVACVLAACADVSHLPFSAGVGPDPTLPQPHRELVPTVNVAPAVGWPAGRTPTAASGLKVGAFASGLQHPRWLYELPDGGILVAETNAPQSPKASAVVPDYALGTHVAALGLASAGGNGLGPEYADGFFVGQHGSWNRKPRSGYNVVFIATAPDGRPRGTPIEILTGFVSPGGDAWGRAVGVVVDRRGALLVADDVGNVVWRVTRDPAAPGARASASAAQTH